jgi:hypothetical protein
MQTRRALAQLREELNQRSYGMLEKYVQEACAGNPGGSPDSSGGAKRKKRRKLKPE